MDRNPTHIPNDRDKTSRDTLQPDPGRRRAQPGDVIGVETDGERTELGDTEQDEDERREDAEEAVSDRDREGR
jgi:hypothetical protein